MTIIFTICEILLLTMSLQPIFTFEKCWTDEIEFQ
jgi:hypothetical protein